MTGEIYVDEDKLKEDLLFCREIRPSKADDLDIIHGYMTADFLEWSYCVGVYI
jgi:hypothetical protein